MIYTRFKKAFFKIPIVLDIIYFLKNLGIKPTQIFIRNKSRLINKHAIEIGGPSKIFEDKSRLFPIYTELLSLDNCNYSENNFWSKIKDGDKIRFNDKKEFGNQIVCDASDLTKIHDATYEVLLSSHVIEHIANPIKALHEWKRILKNNGYLVMIVPHKDFTYDNKRPLSKIEHLVDDFENNIKEDDTTHFQEVIDLHNLKIDTTVASLNAHVERTLDNFNRRIVHHHVFDTELVAKLVHYAGFKILDLQPVRPYHIFIIAEKVGNMEIIDNTHFLSKTSEIYTQSPFLTDKIII
jgi:SAM-dependent methyltransferase